MATNQPPYPVRPTDWDGYLATFQTSLAWLMQHKDPSAEADEIDKQRGHYLEGGGGLPSSVPPLVPGARMVLRAFDLADFAATEFYLRAARRAPAALPTLEQLTARLADAALDSHKAASDLLRVLAYLAAGSNSASNPPYDEHDPSQDGVLAVLREIQMLRSMSEPRRVKVLQDLQNETTTPSLSAQVWRGVVEPMTAKQQQRAASELAILFNIIESEARGYR